jgi:hypothetical protein
MEVGGLKRDLNPPFVRWKFEIKRWVFVCWLSKEKRTPSGEKIALDINSRSTAINNNCAQKYTPSKLRLSARVNLCMWSPERFLKKEKIAGKSRINRTAAFSITTARR